MYRGFLGTRIRGLHASPSSERKGFPLFHCQMCESLVPKGVRSHRLVIKTRPKSYSSRGSDMTTGRRWQSKFKPKTKANYDKGGKGTEIVQELMVCPACAKQHADTQAKTQAEIQAATPVEIPVETPTETPTDTPTA
jgi:hypothetical protein